MNASRDGLVLPPDPSVRGHWWMHHPASNTWVAWYWAPDLTLWDTGTRFADWCELLGWTCHSPAHPPETDRGERA